MKKPNRHLDYWFKAALNLVPGGGAAASLWADYSGDLFEQEARESLPRIPKRLVTRFRRQYRSRYAGASMFYLLRRYEQLEDEIELDLWKDIEDALRSEGFDSQATLFRRGSCLIQIGFGRVGTRGGLKLYFDLEPATGSTGSQPRDPIELEGIGRIRSIQLSLPRELSSIAGKIEQVLAGRVLCAYEELERKLIYSFEQVERHVFSRLYTTIRDHLDRVGKGDLNGRYWLILATDDFVLYFFDKLEFSRVVDHFKNVTSNGAWKRSPLELVAAVLTKTFPFDKSLTRASISASIAEGEPTYLSLAWADAKYQEDAPAIYLAEVKLYASDDYSGFVPCSTRGYHLVVGCPTEIDDDLMEEIKVLAPSLEREFAARLETWSAYVGLLDREFWKERILPAVARQSLLASSELHSGERPGS